MSVCIFMSWSMIKNLLLKIIMFDYNRENDLYKFSKRNVHFSHFFAVRLPA